MYNPNNVFAQIIRGDMPATKVCEDDNFCAILDINPQAPIHIVIFPKKEYMSLEDIPPGRENFIGEMVQFARQIAREQNIHQNYQLHMNVGPDVQQVQHLHLHLLGGWEKGQEPK